MGWPPPGAARARPPPPPRPAHGFRTKDASRAVTAATAVCAMVSGQSLLSAAYRCAVCVALVIALCKICISLLGIRGQRSARR